MTQISQRARNRHREHAQHGWALVPNPMVIKPGSVLVKCPSPCDWLGWLTETEWKAFQEKEPDHG